MSGLDRLSPGRTDRAGAAPRRSLLPFPIKGFWGGKGPAPKIFLRDVLRGVGGLDRPLEGAGPPRFPPKIYSEDCSRFRRPMGGLDRLSPGRPACRQKPSATPLDRPLLLIFCQRQQRATCPLVGCHSKTQNKKTKGRTGELTHGRPDGLTDTNEYERH